MEMAIPRLCENPACRSKMVPRVPRQRMANGQLWCATCVENNSHVQTTAAGWSGEDVIRHEVGRQRVHTVGGDGGPQLCPNHLSIRQSQNDFATGLAAQVGLDHSHARPSVSAPHDGKCEDCARQYGPESKGLPWENQHGTQKRLVPQQQERQPRPHIDTDEHYQRGSWPYRPLSPNKTERHVPLIPGIQSLNTRAAIVVRQGDPNKIRTKARIRIQAHDSGDGETIFHCPFCGSGQVIARSDGTVECEFCTTAFTVQVQPQMPAFPQTIDGMPVQVPGMPAGGANANVPAGGAAGPGADAFPAGTDPGGELGDEDGGGPDDPDAESDGDDKPAFLKGSMLRTASGNTVTRNQLVRHLALNYLPDRERVLAVIRDENGAR